MLVSRALTGSRYVLVVAISPFLARLRQLIGHELLVLPSVAVLPWDDKGQLLLVRQSDHGEWGTIGGRSSPTRRHVTPPSDEPSRRRAS